MPALKKKSRAAHQTAEIVQFSTPRAGYDRTRPIEDAVFFTKSQISVGTELRCMGRLTPNSLWRVEDIVSDFRIQRTHERRNIPAVRHLHDEIYLFCPATRERRQMTFSYLSYSAIWRLVA